VSSRAAFGQRECLRSNERAAPEKFLLNKINSPLHFIRFFKTLLYFVAPPSALEYKAKDGQRQWLHTGAP
jgi:hypothetical protein